LKDQNSKLHDALQDNQLEIDELEQYGRRMCLDISGISGDTGDTNEKTSERKFLIM
jgi:glycyl-tRNA synthetase beta subunit